jgi:hypothetical protein
MIVLAETNKPYVVDSLSQPLPQGARFHWAFSGQQLDFTLNEISYLEETLGPTVTLMIEGAEVKVPGAWNILIVDRETYTVDAVPVTACASFAHEAFIFSPEDGKLITAPIQVVNWESNGSCIYPAIEKANAIVHAVSPGTSHGKVTSRGVVVGPSDLWRYISGKTVGDILG